MPILYLCIIFKMQKELAFFLFIAITFCLNIEPKMQHDGSCRLYCAPGRILNAQLCTCSTVVPKICQARCNSNQILNLTTCQCRAKITSTIKSSSGLPPLPQKTSVKVAASNCGSSRPKCKYGFNLSSCQCYVPPY
jgi:hypothetical protein